MKCLYEGTVHARCPNDSAWDYYAVVVRSTQIIMVEDIRAALNRVAGLQTYQEQLTQTLADMLGAEVTTTGLHGTTRTVVTAGPS